MVGDKCIIFGCGTLALWHSGTLAVTCLLPVRYADLKSAKSARVSSDFLIKAIFDFGNKSIFLP